jgi:hypothetical protein
MHSRLNLVSQEMDLPKNVSNDNANMTISIFISGQVMRLVFISKVTHVLYQ